MLKKIHLDTLIEIESFIAENGFSPTIRELMQLLGLASPAPVQARLKQLIRHGAIWVRPNQYRTIRVLIPSQSLKITPPKD